MERSYPRFRNIEFADEYHNYLIYKEFYEYTKNLKPTRKFNYLSGYFKELIFSFLKLETQHKIFWLNKRLRKFMFYSPLRKYICRFILCKFYDFRETIFRILEVKSGRIACWAEGQIYLMGIKDFQRYYNTHHLDYDDYYDNYYNKKYDKKYHKGVDIKDFYVQRFDLHETFPNKFDSYSNHLSNPITHNTEIIFTDGDSELRIWDQDFNLTQTFSDSSAITCLCNISYNKFAVGLKSGEVKVYDFNEKFEVYDVKQFECHSKALNCLVYLTKYQFLLSASQDKTINLLSLPKEKSISVHKKINDFYISLVSMGDDQVAGGCFSGLIEIFRVKGDGTVEVINSIGDFAYDYICTRIEEFEKLNLNEKDEKDEKNEKIEIKIKNSVEDFNSFMEHNMHKTGVFLNYFGDNLLVGYQPYNCCFKIWNLRNNKCYFNGEERREIIRLIITGDKEIITLTSERVNLWKIKL